MLSWDEVNVLPLEIAKQSFLCSETLHGDFSLRRTKYLGKYFPTCKLGDLTYGKHIIVLTMEQIPAVDHP